MAVVAVPVMAAVGMAVDYTQANAARTAFQAFQYTQVIILLTDGLNTQNRWSTTQSDIDAREQMTCDNIKAAGITLYTIQVNTGGDPTSTLLQNCASDSTKSSC